MLKVERRQNADYRGSGKVVTEEEFGKFHERLSKCFQVGDGRRREHEAFKVRLLHRDQFPEVIKPERHLLKQKEEHLKK